MATIVLVYYRSPLGEWRATYDSHLHALDRHSGHDVYLLNMARPEIPRYLETLSPDLVVFHYTFLAWRQDRLEFERQARRLKFLRDRAGARALVPHDEQVSSEALCWFAQSMRVTHVFSTAPEHEWPRIYEGLNTESVSFRRVLGGYVDDAVERRLRRRARRLDGRPIDIGYRAGSTPPSHGRLGMLKRQIGAVFRDRAAARGLTADISTERSELLFGDDWFRFLLTCKYTLGVEAGSSVFDRDGSIARAVSAYLEAHPDAPFSEVESACFPDADGRFDYRLISPRHLEAVMTRTCQVLAEGEYNGVLEPWTHYIPVRVDLADVDDALALVRADDLRQQIVERAYQDLIASGRYSYRSLAAVILTDTLGLSIRSARASGPRLRNPLLMWNRIDDPLWRTASAWLRHRIPRMLREAKRLVRRALGGIIGEQRLRRYRRRLHGR